MTNSEILSEKLLKDGWNVRHIHRNIYEYTKNLKSLQGQTVMVQFTTIGDYISVAKDIQKPSEYLSYEKFMEYDKIDEYRYEYMGSGEKSFEELWQTVVSSEGEVSEGSENIFGQETCEYLKQIYLSCTSEI